MAHKADLVSRIVDYEAGLMGEEEVIDFFQELADTGLAWELQGHYGRTLDDLVHAGVVTLR